MKAYKDLYEQIITKGTTKKSRQGITTLSLHGAMLQHDMSQGFPLLTTKKINFKHIVVETLWYLMGTGDISFLQENDVKIWDAFTKADGTIGPTYGYQWRRFNGSYQHDQLQDVIKTLKSNPDSRRMIINGWNPLQLKDMALPPCITQMQFLANNGKLDLIISQRSADFAIGVPYDIAEMALILSIIAELTGFTPGVLTIMYGDIHIYEDHLEDLNMQMNRGVGTLPTLKLINTKDFEYLDDFEVENFILRDYKPQSFIKYKVFV
jgi:thymidylate synthase